MMIDCRKTTLDARRADRQPAIARTATGTGPADDHSNQQLPKLPTRRTHNQSMAATLRIWHTRNIDLLERVAAGLRHLDPPAACKSAAPIRGRAHAMHVMADHATHNCARFRLAAQYIEANQ
ncbi:hypothetical protein [Nocardia africana]|uniref:Uncharacterized protein n=1 Tax=Nocardia africana TaxID=134964 RepID=A0ABW6NLP8_9NOCA